MFVIGIFFLIMMLKLYQIRCKFVPNSIFCTIAENGTIKVLAPKCNKFEVGVLLSFPSQTTETKKFEKKGLIIINNV